MRKIPLFTYICGGTALIASMIGCGTTTTNTNINANMRNANANSTVVVSPTPTNTNLANANVTREEYDRNRAEYERDRGESTIGQGANDSWLWFKTKTALATANDLRDSTINVDVVNDVITLRGTVASAAQKSSAEAVAKGIEGQKGVRNQLTVRAGDSVTNQIVNGNTSNVNRR
jgi:hypothetical protein